MSWWRSIAKFKIFMTRAQSWAAPYSFFMMYYLFLEKIYSNGSLHLISEYFPFKIDLLRIVLATVPVISLIILTLIDMKKIWPEEMGYSFEKNPEWKELRGSK